jgi:hypothetical protein
VRSSGDVRAATAKLLCDVLPRRADVVREAKGLSSRELPNPGKVFDGHAPDLAYGGGKEPVWIAVTNPRHVPPMRAVDWAGGLPVYETRYALQIEVWCLGADWATAIATRDEVEALVRGTLIEYPNLSTDGTIETGYALHPPTVMSQFGTPIRAPNQSGRTWAPALVSVDIRAEDVMSTASIEEPPTWDAVGLYFVKVPTGEQMPDPATEDGRHKITEEWADGDPRYVSELGG